MNYNPGLDARLEAARSGLSEAWASLPWKEITQASDLLSLPGGIASAISVYNSFRQVHELKEINSKLDTVIDMQYKTLSAIRQLGVQFRKDLESAFVRDIEIELKAYHKQFTLYCTVLNPDNLKFPDSPYNYPERLAELTQATVILTFKLAGYGTAAYQAVFASACLVDSMCKLQNMDQKYRSAFFSQMETIALEFESTFKNNLSQLRKTIAINSQKESKKPREKLLSHGPIEPVETWLKVEGKLEDGYTFLWCQCNSNTPSKNRRYILLTSPYVDKPLFKPTVDEFNALRRDYLLAKEAVERTQFFLQNAGVMREMSRKLLQMYSAI